MSEKTLKNHNTTTAEKEMWKIRWFLIRLYAVALLLSIPASAIIVILTKNPLPELIPPTLLTPMIAITRWAFHNPQEEAKQSLVTTVKKIALKKVLQTNDSHPTE